MKPTLVIVGRPNVGKSTLFNRLTRTRDALVAPVPGLTRDRHYGLGRLGERPYLVVENGGLEPEARGVFVEMARQARTAIAETAVIVLVTDAREGLTVQDRAIGEELRRIGRRVFVAVNKAEGMNPSLATLEFHEMGLGMPYAISAAHGEGVHDLVEAALADFPVEEESGGKVWVVQTVQAIERANVAVLVLDAQGEISDQDAHIAGFVLERGRAVVVAVNKWDGMDSYARDMTKRAIARRLKFLSFARFHYISAREGRGLAKLVDSVDAAYRAAMAKLPTPRLTRTLIAAVAKQA